MWKLNWSEMLLGLYGMRQLNCVGFSGTETLLANLMKIGLHNWLNYARDASPWSMT